MSYDLQVLADNRDALLLAEVAAWLHNLGKLEPRFLVDAMEGETPDNLPFALRIPPSSSGLSQYSFRRFAKPSILQSDFPYADYAGVLYFPEKSLRQNIEELDERLDRIRSELNRTDLSLDQRRDLGRQLEEVKREKRRVFDKMITTEKSNWNQLERQIEQCSISSLSWPLGSLLTMFWESEWFDKPNIENYEPGSEDDPDYKRTPKLNIKLAQSTSTMDLPALLLLAHGEISGQEKKGVDRNGQYVDVEKYGETSPSLDKLRLSTAFGFERELSWKKWQGKRKQIVDWALDKWRAPIRLKAEITTNLQPLLAALGDTQRPINEISLWDFSASTAALFKTAVAQFFLSGQMPTPATMRWRLLSVRLNALDFLTQASQLADLLARAQMLKEAQQIIRWTLEVEYPIGMEVYADEDGSVFTLPEMPGVEDEKIERELKSLLEDVLDGVKPLTASHNNTSLYGSADIRPSVNVGTPRQGKKLNLQEVISQAPATSTPPPEIVEKWWQSAREDLCVACGFRPVGYLEAALPGFVTKKKARERRLCGVCLARRGRRARDWATKENESEQTIWIDEVADVNGRVALVLGRFEMDDWLNGTLVHSLPIGTSRQGNWLVKTPTFARIHRVWRTTAEFWQDTRQQIRNSLKDNRRRLRIWLDKQPDLGDYHVYELKLGQTILSVAWIPPQNEQEGYLISTDNLGQVARLLGAEEEIFAAPSLAAIHVEDAIRQKLIESNEWSLVLHNPEGASNANLLQGCRIKATDHQDIAYSTAIPILAEPRTFMALVPANRAIEVVQEIKKKYEREMGKVRNRLPLHLGVVYADRRTPLRAALDTGRRMLRKPNLTVQAEVTSISPVVPWPEKVALTLKLSGREITVAIPTVMGDGITPDVWYPYWKVTGKPTDRNRWFVGPDGEHWVHVCDLRPGDTVDFTPSTFDFEYLDVSARRFEVAYGKDGSRLGQDKKQRPYLLEEVEALESVWRQVSKLSTSQIKALEEVIEAKRQDWDEPSGFANNFSDTFRQFVKDTLGEAEIHTPELEAAALTGMLADALEIYLTIHKGKTLEGE